MGKGRDKKIEQEEAADRIMKKIRPLLEKNQKKQGYA